MTIQLSGIVPALTTPFENGRLALNRLTENIERYNQYGFSGYLALGSTGESPLLEDDECVAVLKTLRKCAAPQKTIIAGIGRESTTDTIEFAQRAAEAGAEIALVVTPSYYKEQMTAPALTAYYTAVADSSPIPILLYNVPKFTGVQIPLETIGNTISHPNIAGIKDSSGNISFLAEAMKLCKKSERYAILVGAGTVVFPALMMGATGGILALSDFAPAETVTLYNAFKRGDFNRSNELQIQLAEANNVIVGKYGVPGIKCAVDAIGLFGGEPRPPLIQVGSEVKNAIHRILMEARLI
jgi:4-hydroxy-2-oxoglutarate aldolase